MTTADVLKELVREVVREELAHRDIKPANDEYVSPAEAARITKFSVESIRRWVLDGSLAGENVNRRVRIPRAELDRFMARGRRPAPRELPVDELVERRMQQRRGAR